MAVRNSSPIDRTRFDLAFRSNPLVSDFHPTRFIPNFGSKINRIELCQIEREISRHMAPKSKPCLKEKNYREFPFFSVTGKLS